MMIITICGGGNAAHTLAGLLGSKPDVRVNLYLPLAGEERRWQEGIKTNGGIAVHFPDGVSIGRPHKVSANPAEVLPGSEIVLLALPAFAHETILRDIASYLKRGSWIGALPARGGFEWCGLDCLGQQIDSLAVFGLQTLPWACRIERFGHSVRVKGTKSMVEMAARPADKAGEMAAVLEDLLGLALRPVDCFLCLTLANTGQLLHPGLMYGLFRDWDGAPFTKQPLFYQGVNADTEDILLQMSDEIQHLRARLETCFPCMDFSFVRPLIDWIRCSYPNDIGDPTSLQSCLKTNRSYAGLTAPMVEGEHGWLPDFQSRYLTEDVPYGLVVTRGIAEMAGVKTPVMDEVILWSQEQTQKEYLVPCKAKLCRKLMGKDIAATRAPQRYGFSTLDMLDR